MLNPSSLQRRALEVQERLAFEKLQAEERQRIQREQQAREEEARQLQAMQALKRMAAVRKMRRDLVHQAIQASVQGAHSLQEDVPDELTDDLLDQLRVLGFACKAESISAWDITTEKRISRLVEKLSSYRNTEKYRHNLSRMLEFRRFGADGLIRLIARLTDDPDVDLIGDAETYIRLTVLPHLNQNSSAASADEDGDELESAEPIYLDRVTLEIRPLDVSQNKLSALYQVPGWILSTGGSGLINRINECASSEAEQGSLMASFELQSLPISASRWGQNSMTKYVYGGKPIGVMPFGCRVMAETMAVLGFKSTSTDGEHPTLSLAWA